MSRAGCARDGFGGAGQRGIPTRIKGTTLSILHLHNIRMLVLLEGLLPQISGFACPVDLLVRFS